MQWRAFSMGMVSGLLLLMVFLFFIERFSKGVSLLVTSREGKQVHMFFARSEVLVASCLAAFLPFPKAKSVFREGDVMIEAPEAKYTDRIYLDVSLEKKVMTLFDNGEVVEMYRIAAMGNPRYSPTPRGEFQVLNKKPNHFSSISHVWMPWSIHFYGDYFIHGIPYYPGGVPYNGPYSAGCVRVPTDQQEDLYQKIAVGTLVVVY